MRRGSAADVGSNLDARCPVAQLEEDSGVSDVAGDQQHQDVGHDDPDAHLRWQEGWPDILSVELISSRHPIRHIQGCNDDQHVQPSTDDDHPRGGVGHVVPVPDGVQDGEVPVY